MNNTQFDTELSPIGKLRFALLAMLLLVFGGTFGFGVLEDMEPIDALYMTVITLSTVGYTATYTKQNLRNHFHYSRLFRGGLYYNVPWPDDS